MPTQVDAAQSGGFRAAVGIRIGTWSVLRWIPTSVYYISAPAPGSISLLIFLQLYVQCEKWRLAKANSRPSQLISITIC